MAKLYQSITTGLLVIFILSPIIQRIVKKVWLKALLCVLILVIVASVRIQGLTTAAYLTGILSNLSITTSIILLFSAITLVSNTPSYFILQKNFYILMLIIAVSGLFLYPFSWATLIAFYPYSFGFNALLLPVCYLVLGLILMWWDSRYLYVASLLVLVVYLYILRLFNGDNFWNYLTDPLITIYAVAYVIWKFIKGQYK